MDYMDNNGTPLTVTSVSYVYAMEKYSLLAALPEVNAETWRQLAVPQGYSRTLKCLIPNRIISRYEACGIDRSTACYLKGMASTAPPPHITELERRLQKEVTRIPVSTLCHLTNKMRSISEECSRRNRGRLKDTRNEK